ncbi:MAG: HEAT repeat domain-containing protein [Aureliella sp.]
MDENWVHATLRWLQADEAPPLGESVVSAINHAPIAELEHFVESLSAVASEYPRSGAKSRVPLQCVAGQLKSLREEGGVDPRLLRLDPDILSSAYEVLGNDQPMAAAHLIQMLAIQSDDDSLAALARSIEAMPPASWQATAVGLSPLWNADGETLLALFHQLDGSLMQASVLSVVLDLAGHAVRSEKLTEHPWATRGDQFRKLLQSVIGQLRTLQADPSKFGDDVDTVQSALHDGVALAIALCDALGLIGHKAAKGELEDAMELAHRRIQTEAAGALARMGDEMGKKHLVTLAADRVARQRAVAYAEELGCAESIAEEFRSAAAIAESQLAGWLSEPPQYGIAPSGMELVDERTMYWPSYDEPRECFLFRYWFNFPAGKVQNLGIAGPVCHAFSDNLESLSHDDIYAAFAGWHAEHDDIFAVPAHLLNPAQRREADNLLHRVYELDFVEVKLEALTFFLGTVAILAVAQKTGRNVTIVVDDQECLSMPRSEAPGSLTSELVLAIYRGRKLLRSFNGV